MPRGGLWCLRATPSGVVSRRIFLKTEFFNSNFKITMAYVITDSCVACGTCLPECPVEAISEGEIYHIDPDTCIECGSCAAVCPNDAILPPQ